MKPIRLARHAKEQCLERWTDETEICHAVLHGDREPAKLNREMCRYNFVFGRDWQGRTYAIKQVAPIIKEEPDEIVVLTVYTFFF